MEDDMSEMPQVSVTEEEARAFASRLGLAWIAPEHLEPLARAMTAMNAAGRTVPRVATKMAQPADVFRVSGTLPRV
jgi:hypothetical protein